MYLKTPEVFMFCRTQVILAAFLWTPFYWSMFIFKNIAQYRPEYLSNGFPTGKPGMENYCSNNSAHLTHEGLCAETLLFEIVILPLAPQAVLETMSEVNFTDVLTPLILDPYSKCQNPFSSQNHPVTYGRSFQNDTAQSKYVLDTPYASIQAIGKNIKLYQMQKRPTQCPAYWWNIKKHKMSFSNYSGTHLLTGHKLLQNKQLMQCFLSSVNTTHHKIPQSIHRIKICPIWPKETMLLSRLFQQVSTSLPCWTWVNMRKTAEFPHDHHH